jgi:predicted secreted acid phosphatase
VKRLVRALALVALGVMLATAVGALGKKKPLAPAKPEPSPAISIRATGVGVPEIGEQGTVAISDLASALRTYHDGGQYASDLSSVDSQAQSFMLRQAKAVRQKSKRKCNAKRKKNKKAKCAAPKLAITLDIDETSLSNYTQLEANNFSNAPTALTLAAVSGTSPAIAPTLSLYHAARAAGISVFAITGRPALVETVTRQNLSNAGYTDLQGIFFKPSSDAVVPFKSGQRAALEQQGYRIIENVGDQESDLAGGHADRSFKLPNPFYFIS